MNADQAITDALDAPEPGTDEFTEAVHEAFAAQADPAQDDGAGEVQEEVTAPPAPETEPPPAVEDAAPDEVELAGHRIPATQAEALADFWTWSQGAGQPWVQTLSQLMEAGIDPATVLDKVITKPPPPQREDTPEEDVYVDPEVKALRDQLNDTNTQLQELRSRQEAQAASEAFTVIQRAKATFAADHNLTADETNELVTYMDRTSNLAGFNTNPDGSPRDSVSTVIAAMESAFWSLPEYRQRELDRVAHDQKAQQKKSRKLAAVGGTSGSVPQRPIPETPEELEEWAVQQIADHIGASKS